MSPTATAWNCWFWAEKSTLRRETVKLTEHFSKEEFEVTSQALPNDIHEGEILENISFLAAILEVIRFSWGKAIEISSGYRSPAVNKAVGGSPFSQHMKGEAADITFDTKSERCKFVVLLWGLKAYLPIDQVIVYESTFHVHFSVKRIGKNRGEWLQKVGGDYQKLIPPTWDGKLDSRLL